MLISLDKNLSPSVLNDDILHGSSLYWVLKYRDFWAQIFHKWCNDTIEMLWDMYLQI